MAHHLPRHSLFPPNQFPRPTFSHTSSLYDVLGKPQFKLLPPQILLLILVPRHLRGNLGEEYTGKETNEDGFYAEIFQHDLHALYDHLANLFNLVVHTSFPQTWTHHIIHPIHKSSPNANPNNYRTIMVGHTLLKLCSTILHMKLSRELECRHLGARGRSRFRHAHQTITHILTLQDIIDKARHCSSKVSCVL
jgi:hypothetical protein